MLYKIKNVGSKDGRFVQIETKEGDKWVEINPQDGTIIREISSRRFVEHDDMGNIIAIHDIECSELIETIGSEAFMAGKKGFEVKEKALKEIDSKELLEKYCVKAGRLEKKV